MLSITTDMREKQGLDADKWYEAEVLENDDSKYHPDKRMLGRIQARISVIFDGVCDAELPWAIPTWNHPDGANELSGTFSVPKKGTKVFLKFQQGKPDFPMYQGYHVDNITQMEETKLHYPNRTVVRFSNKAMAVIDTQDDVMYLRNPGNLKIFIDGNVEIEIKGDVDEKIHGTVRREILGNLHETVRGHKHLQVDSYFDETVKGAKHLNTLGNRTDSTGGTTDVYSSGKFTIESAANMAIEGGSMIYENCGQGLGQPAPPQIPKIPQFQVWPGIPGGAQGTNVRTSLNGKSATSYNGPDGPQPSSYSSTNGKVTYGEYKIKCNRSAPIQTPHED